MAARCFAPQEQVKGCGGPLLCPSVTFPGHILEVRVFIPSRHFKRTVAIRSPSPPVFRKQEHAHLPDTQQLQQHTTRKRSLEFVLKHKRQLHTRPLSRTAIAHIHSVAQNNTQAVLGIGSAGCAFTPNVHSLANELPTSSGSHWLKTPNTEEPVSKITLKDWGGEPIDTLMKYLSVCYEFSVVILGEMHGGREARVRTVCCAC